MGVIGFKIDGKDIPYSEFDKLEVNRELLDKMGIPAPMLEVLMKRRSGWYHTGDRISTTSMLYCNRKTVLQRRVDYFEEPKSMYWMMRGDGFHKMMEMKLKFNARYEVERRISKDILLDSGHTITISGQFDLYDKDTKTVYDYKTMNSRGIPFIANDPKVPHVQQLNILRWLMYPHYEVDRVVICFVNEDSMVESGGVIERTFRNYLRPPMKKDNEISRKAVDSRVLRNEKPTKTYTIKYRIPEIPLHDIEDVEKFIKHYAGILHDAYKNGVIPSIEEFKADSNSQWMCGFCPVKEVCDRIESQGYISLDELRGDKKIGGKISEQPTS